MAVHLEQLIRPFVTLDTHPPEPGAAPPVSDLGALPQAFIEWGAASDFFEADSGVITSELISKIIIPPGSIPTGDILRDFEDSIEDQEDDEEEEVQPTLDYKEIARTTTVSRVTNPSDPAQYVDFEDAKDITFQGPDGKKIRLIFRQGGSA